MNKKNYLLSALTLAVMAVMAGCASHPATRHPLLRWKIFLSTSV